MTIIIRSVFEEDGKLYPQLFLDDTFYELVQKMLQHERIDVSEGTDANKTKKNVSFVIISILKMLNLNLKSMFVMDVMIY